MYVNMWNLSQKLHVIDFVLCKNNKLLHWVCCDIPFPMCLGCIRFSITVGIKLLMDTACVS